MQELEIRDEMIRLGQLLKLAGLAEDGVDAKEMLEDGEVSVNNEPEHRRGRQVHPGDVISVGTQRFRVTGPR